MALTEKMKAFCREYMVNGGNGTQAYLTAYDSKNEQVAANEASILLKKEEIQAYLASMNKPLEDKAISEREKKRAILWEFINNPSVSDGDRLRAMDLLNKMDAEYININKNIDENKSDITHLDTEALKKLSEDV